MDSGWKPARTAYISTLCQHTKDSKYSCLMHSFIQDGGVRDSVYLNTTTMAGRVERLHEGG